MIAIDSSGWLEYFADGPHSDEFAAYLAQPDKVFTSVVAIYEVYKWLKRERSEQTAVQAVAAMKKTRVVDITEQIALTAGDISLTHGLAMADSIIIATARNCGVRLATTDSDFSGIADVLVFSKKKKR